MRNPLSKTITSIKPSGIRKFFDIVNTMEDAISLGVGEPDFDTAEEVKEAAKVAGIPVIEVVNTLEEATRLLVQSHREVLELVEDFSTDELFTKGVYQWTGGTSLGSYFVSSTSSHYDWALKKLKAHQKNCKSN